MAHESFFLPLLPCFIRNRENLCRRRPPRGGPVADDRPRAGRRRAPPLSFSLFSPSFPLSLSKARSCASATIGQTFTGRMPRADGGHWMLPKPGEPAGTLSGPNQATDRLGSARREGRWLYSDCLERPDTPPLSPLRPPRAAGHNNGRTRSSRSPSQPLTVSPMNQWKGAYQSSNDSDG